MIKANGRSQAELERIPRQGIGLEVGNGADIILDEKERSRDHDGSTAETPIEQGADGQDCKIENNKRAAPENQSLGIQVALHSPVNSLSGLLSPKRILFFKINPLSPFGDNAPRLA